MEGVMWWALAEVEGCGLVTANWLNRRVMNGPGAWLWNGLQMPGILLQACQNTQLICCIGRRRKSLEFLFEIAAAWHNWRLLLAWPSALIKTPSRSALKITLSSLVCMFPHRSTSQSNLPGYYNSHSVPWPQYPPTHTHIYIQPSAK